MRAVSLSCCLVVLIFGSLPAAAQSEAHEERVRELLEVMRAGDMGVQVMNGMIESMKTTTPQVSEAFWIEFAEDVEPSELVDLLVPIYAKHIEPDDVEELIRFFRSPTGQRFLERQPQIMAESMAAGEEWGAQVAARIIKRLRAAQSKK